jgi:hypothetical protein
VWVEVLVGTHVVVVVTHVIAVVTRFVAVVTYCGDCGRHRCDRAIKRVSGGFEEKEKGENELRYDAPPGLGSTRRGSTLRR